ncbi:MAG TPA: alpha/beta fold hydrolase, partial [Planctomycetaceae bacterium]|nr:alpha/beta fold hydrolase [Planctomycetaceae bacterium]
MARILVNGVHLNVETAGSGRPLLLVHGFPLDHRMWRRQFDEFSRTNRVIAPDLRGFGKSDVTRGTVTMERFADDLAGLLDALHVYEPVVFCGLSMGGYIGWQFVRKHAKRVRGLVLCDTRSVADSEEARRLRMKTAADVLASGPGAIAEAMLQRMLASSTFAHRSEIVEELRASILSQSSEAVAAASRGMAERPDVQELLPRIEAPSLVIVGEHDAISPPAEMEQIAQGIPGAAYVVIPDAGHMTPLEAPAAF